MSSLCEIVISPGVDQLTVSPWTGLRLLREGDRSGDCMSNDIFYHSRSLTESRMPSIL